jgi:type II pantothenate kinase
MAEENNKIDLKIKNITNKLLIGLDIGGTLTKVCIIISKEEKDIKIENFLSGHKYKYIEIDLYKLYFCHLHSANYKKDILPILNELNKIIKIEKINATGGGAYKYYDLMKKDFGIEFIKNDEMQSLIYGYEFMNKYNSFYEINNNITKTIPSSLA